MKNSLLLIVTSSGVQREWNKLFYHQ